MSNQIQPVFILPEGTKRTSGKGAQKMNIEAAKMVADQVRTTLGPKGMDKMIVDTLGDVTVTNDGVTILQEMNIEHPSAKMIVEIAKTQEDEVGDGTTTAVVLAGELLKNAQDLLEKNIHPTIIAKGFRLATEKSMEILNKIAEPVTIKDKDTLKSISMTAMVGKGAEASKEKLAEIVIKSVVDVAEESEGKIYIDKEDIKVEKKVGGGIEDSELIEGVVLDKERVHSGMPRVVNGAKIALVDSALEIKDTEVDAKIQITDPSQMKSFLDQEENMIKEMVEKVVRSGANAVFCQKGIDDLAQHFLAKQGIYAARRVKKSDMDKLARAIGARVVTNLDDISEKDLGKAGLVEEIKVGDEEMTFVRACKNPKSVTILVRGGTEHVVDEAKRAIDDSIGDVIAALTVGKIVGGAGAAELELSKALTKYGNSLSGKEQLAVQSFASAIEVIPITLSESAGLDPIDKLAELKSAHDKGMKWAGINVFTGKVIDSWRAKIIEPLKIKTQAVKSAAEVANMILRIDDVVAGSSKPAIDPSAMGMPPGGMPPM